MPNLAATTSQPPLPDRGSDAFNQPDERHNSIMRAAYIKAEQRGFAGDREWNDWFSAEREIDAAIVDITGAECQMAPVSVWDWLEP